MWQVPLVQATIRGILLALVVAGLAFFTALSQGESLRQAGVAAGVAGFGILVSRFGEGMIDQARLTTPVTGQNPKMGSA